MGARPVDIARQLHISTNALRHWEAWEIVPPVKRAVNGYRLYTEQHIAYFECIRAMSPGFGMATTSEVLRKMVANEIDDALWLVSGAQAALYERMQMAEKTIQVLDTDMPDHLDARGRVIRMTIGAVSAKTSVPASAIRHWEKMGLIDVARDQENGYRTFSRSQIRRILIIGTLRSAVWSLDTIKEVTRELDHNNVEQARRIARESLQFLNETNRQQMRGIRYLHRLIELAQG